MKFELVEPQGWDCAGPAGEAGATAQGGGASGESREAEPPDPAARIQAATARLSGGVGKEAAEAGQAVSGLLERVARMRREAAASGQRVPGTLPSTFRANRFSGPGRRGDSEPDRAPGEQQPF